MGKHGSGSSKRRHSSSRDSDFGSGSSDDGRKPRKRREITEEEIAEYMARKAQKKVAIL